MHSRVQRALCEDSYRTRLTAETAQHALALTADALIEEAAAECARELAKERAGQAEAARTRYRMSLSAPAAAAAVAAAAAAAATAANGDEIAAVAGDAPSGPWGQSEFPLSYNSSRVSW
jgi:hypothetical protein